MKIDHGPKPKPNYPILSDNVYKCTSRPKPFFVTQIVDYVVKGKNKPKFDSNQYIFLSLLRKYLSSKNTQKPKTLEFFL